MVFHPVDLERLSGALDVLGAWFLPQARGAGAAAIIMVVFLAVFVALKAEPREPQGRLILLLLLSFLMYILLLLISISLFDFYTPLDTRILAPGLVVLMAALGVSFALKAAPLPLWGFVSSAVLAVSVAVNLVPLSQVLESNSRSPSGYLNPALRFSPILRILHSIPAERIVSNAPELVRLVDGRDAGMVPAFYDPVTARYSPGYTAEMDALVRAAAAGGIAIVMFKAFEWRGYIPDARVFEGALGVPPLYSGKDGEIFLVTPGHIDTKAAVPAQ